MCVHVCVHVRVHIVRVPVWNTGKCAWGLKKSTPGAFDYMVTGRWATHLRRDGEGFLKGSRV